MVDKQLQEYIAEYDVSSSRDAKNERTTFLTITENQQNGLSFTVHYEKDLIYAVSFLNNEFFELPEEDLYKVVECILEGRYEIRKTFFLKKKSVKATSTENKTLIPERISQDTAFAASYQNLPRSFKQQ